MQLQLDMAPQTLSQLRECGVGEDKELKLEFFFFTNTAEKAEYLGKVLVDKGYSCEFGESADNKDIFVTTGWTGPIQMSHENIIEWTGEMCVIGHRNDCEFDGWGTNPGQ